MKRFAKLYATLDATTKTNAKVAALADYFREAPRADAAWALSFLMGRRLLRLLNTNLLVGWTLELARIPPWLLEECYGAVGDLAEVIALLLEQPGRASSEVPLHVWIEERVLPLYDLEPAEQKRAVTARWSQLPRDELFLLNKILTGEMRVGVSHKLVVRGLAQALGTSEDELLHRLMGPWEPSPAIFDASAPLGGTGNEPYPFFLASPLPEEQGPGPLGARDEWFVEWKWDGIRAQVVRRGKDVAIWSRGEDLVTERFPEVLAAARNLPAGTVLDGELLAWSGDRPLPFATLQKRIGRRALGKKILAEAPVAFLAFDLLEEQGRDIRSLLLVERRERLEKILPTASAIRVSTLVDAPSWDALAKLREESRARGVEGFVLKRRSSPYRAGRKRGDWWKWKVAPFTLDAVLVHAQPGNGRRASVYTDYTFAIWDREKRELVTIAKAYSGLTDDEIDELDRWVREHVRARHGPFLTVEPELVFELGFEAIARSTRHRSGIAVRFPRILRWRRDKKAENADSIESVLALLPPEPPAPKKATDGPTLFPL